MLLRIQRLQWGFVHNTGSLVKQLSILVIRNLRRARTGNDSLLEALLQTLSGLPRMGSPPDPGLHNPHLGVYVPEVTPMNLTSSARLLTLVSQDVYKAINCI